jgi:hypothetical protein
MPKRALLIPLLALASLLLYAGDGEWKIYHSDRFGYSFEHPAGWLEELDEETGIYAITLTDTLAFPVNISILVENLNEQEMEMDLDQFMTASTEAMESELEAQGFTDFRILANEATTLGGAEAYLLDLQATVMLWLELRLKTIAARHEGKVYMISFSTDPGQFETYDAIFNHVLDSYSFDR